MTATEHNHAIAVFQQPPAFNVVQNIHLCRTNGVNGREKVRCHHTARIAAVIDVERLYQRTVLCFLGASKRVIRIRTSTQPRAILLAQIVPKVELVNLDDLFSFTRSREGPLEEFRLLGIRIREEGSFKRREFSRKLCITEGKAKKS